MSHRRTLEQEPDKPSVNDAEEANACFLFAVFCQSASLSLSL